MGLLLCTIKPWLILAVNRNKPFDILKKGRFNKLNLFLTK